MSAVVETIFGQTPNAPQEPASVGQATSIANQIASDAQTRQGDQYAWSKDLADAQLGVSNQAVAQSLDVMKDSWEKYKALYSPIEEQSVNDAKNYDSPEEMARVRQEATAGANSAFDAAENSRRVELARMGVNPNSGRFADPNATSLMRAAGVADAGNRAAAGRRDSAIALRSGVATAGRALPGVALTAGGAASTTANNTAAAVLQGTGTPIQWAQTGVTGASVLGNIGNAAWGNQNQSYGLEDASNKWRSNFGLDTLTGIGKGLGKM